MSDIQGYDRTRATALYSRALPNPLPASAILVVGADGCPDSQRTMIDNNYATRTRDGREIYYINDADAASHRALGALPNVSILGGGYNAANPPQRPERQYNHPTVLEISNGQLSRVLFADTVPANGLLDPAALEQLRTSTPAYQFDLARALGTAEQPGILGAPVPTSLQPNTVYAVVSHGCGHCKDLLVRNDYAAATEDGRPITYIDVATEAGRAFQQRFLPTGGWPTILETNAQGVPSQTAQGPDAILTRYFPAKAGTAHVSQPQRTATLPDATDAASVTNTTQISDLNTSHIAALDTQQVAAITQDNLISIGTAMATKVAAGDTAAIAAIEKFYADSGTAMQGLGTISETEMTEVLNRMQHSTFDAAVRTQVATLGTALGVGGLTAATTVQTGSEQAPANTTVDVASQQTSGRRGPPA